MHGRKEDFRESVNVIADYETLESGQRRVLEAGEYFLSNWTVARLRLTNRDIVKGCSISEQIRKHIKYRIV